MGEEAAIDFFLRVSYKYRVDVFVCFYIPNHFLYVTKNLSRFLQVIYKNQIDFYASFNYKNRVGFYVWLL